MNEDEFWSCNLNDKKLLGLLTDPVFCQNC